MKTHRVFRPLSLAALTSLTVAATAPPARAADVIPSLSEIAAALGRSSTLELDLAGAHSILDAADGQSPAIAVERARLALYEGDCDRAVELLTRGDLSTSDETKHIGEIARGCARATAATVTIHDKEKGVWVRLQDDDDAALVPFIIDVADRARETLARDLGVRLPSPLRIELVRDQLTLSAVTGLPYEAAQTTGTVAIAKWGRVTMLSPRANGYGWMDTLAHELSHLALTAGTRDKAPLWLQEGIAKREETRWREPWPHDDTPPGDSFAAVGIAMGLGRPLDKLGPSIAMLPSAEEASVAYAEVSSFVRFFASEIGDDALPRLTAKVKEVEGPDPAAIALKEVSGLDLAAWDARWRQHLAGVSKDIPPELKPGATFPKMKEVMKAVRLGQLLQDRGHPRQAAVEHSIAQLAVPWESAVRCHLASSLLAAGDTANAKPLVAHPEEVHGHSGRYWTLHAFLHPAPEGDPRASFLGIALDPLSPEVACEEKPAPDLPTDPLRQALCQAARRIPR
ncbi:MAG: hypothetical protein R3F14_38660 [Polyangiaceae bacterium]